MNSVSRQQLVSALQRRLALANVDSNSFFSQAQEIVVFGSRAIGVNSDDSDLDVLCFTDRKVRIKTRQLDCICSPRSESETSYWKTSELAFHIARYGVWISGQGTWRNSVHPSKDTIERKQRRVESLIRNAVCRWQQFHPLFRKKYATSVRRELQRLYLLESEVPIPPTPVLDSEWNLQKFKSEQLIYVASHVPGVMPRYSLWVSNVLNGKET
jgi:hypothetical protein